MHYLGRQGWRGVWVNSFGPRELRPEWFPAPAVKTLAETGAPDWAVEAFERLRAANESESPTAQDDFYLALSAQLNSPGQTTPLKARSRSCRI